MHKDNKTNVKSMIELKIYIFEDVLFQEENNKSNEAFGNKDFWLRNIAHDHFLTVIACPSFEYEF